MALDTRESIPEISVFHVHRQEALDLVEIAEFYLSPTLAHHSVRLIRLPIVKTIKNRQREREKERRGRQARDVGRWIFLHRFRWRLLNPAQSWRRLAQGMRFERATCIIRAQPVMLESVSTPTRPYPPSSSAKERRLGNPRRVYLCSLNLAKLPILIKIKTSSKTWPSTIRSLERTSIAMHPPLHSHPSQHDVPRDQKLLRALPGQRALTACERSRGCNRAWPLNARG